MIRKRGKLNKKTIYILSIIIVLFIVYFLFEYQRGKVERYNEKYKVSEELLSNKKYGGLSIKKIKLNELGGSYSFTAKVKNNSGAKHEIEPVKLVFLDKTGNKVCEVNSNLPRLDVDEEFDMYAMIGEECRRAYTFVIERVEGENSYE